MTISSSQVTISNSATLIHSDAGAFGGASITVINRGSNPIFLGDTNVTTGAGLELKVGDILPINLGRGESLYGIVASGSERLDLLVTSG